MYIFREVAIYLDGHGSKISQNLQSLGDRQDMAALSTKRELAATSAMQSTNVSRVLFVSEVAVEEPSSLDRLLIALSRVSLVGLEAC